MCRAPWQGLKTEQRTQQTQPTAPVASRVWGEADIEGAVAPGWDGKCPSVGSTGGPLAQPKEIKQSFLEEEAPQLRPEGEQELAGWEWTGGLKRLLVFEGPGGLVLPPPFSAPPTAGSLQWSEEGGLLFHLPMCEGVPCLEGMGTPDSDHSTLSTGRTHPWESSLEFPTTR